MVKLLIRIRQPLAQALTDLYDNEVQNGPEASEVLLKAVSQPLEHHLDEEEDGEHDVHVGESLTQRLLLVKVFILRNYINSVRVLEC